MSALDAQLRERLRVQVRRIQSELGITTVYVTHDQEEALAISDRVAVMRDGTPEQIAPRGRCTGSRRAGSSRSSSATTTCSWGGWSMSRGDVDDSAPRTAGVDVGGEILRVEVDDVIDVAPGDRLTFCVRPEYLRIGDGGEPNPGDRRERGVPRRDDPDNPRLGRSRPRGPDARSPSGEVVVGFDPADAHMIGIGEE